MDIDAAFQERFKANDGGFNLLNNLGKHRTPRARACVDGILS